MTVAKPRFTDTASINHGLVWIGTLNNLSPWPRFLEDRAALTGGSVKGRGFIQAFSMIYMGSLPPSSVPPSLHVLTEFLNVPAATAAKEIGITKGRLSQILSSNKPMSHRLRVRLHVAARQGVLGWQQISDSWSANPLGTSFDEPVRQMLVAVIKASNEFLRLDAEELGIDDEGQSG